MSGFSDLHDLDLIGGDELARRMGYSSLASLRRAFRRRGAPLPRAFLRGRYRAVDVKGWFLSLALSPGDGQQVPAADTPLPVPPPAILSLEAERRRRKLALVR